MASIFSVLISTKILAWLIALTKDFLKLMERIEFLNINMYEDAFAFIPDVSK